MAVIMKTTCWLALAWAAVVCGEEIRSIDGKIIEAQISKVDLQKELVVLVKDGVRYEVPLAKLDKHTVADLVSRDLVELKRDRFDGSQQVALKDPIQLTGEESLIAAGLIEPAQFFYFIVNHTLDDWRWLEHHPVVLLIDGQQRIAPESELNTEVFDSGKCYEAACFRLSPAEFDRARKATRLELRVGTTEMEIAPTGIKLLSILYERWRIAAHGGHANPAAPGAEPVEITKGATMSLVGQSFGGKSIDVNWRLPWGSYDKDFTSERGILLTLSTTSPKAKEKPFVVKLEWAWVARAGRDETITRGGEEILEVRSGQLVKFFTPPGVFSENRVRLVALKEAWDEGQKYVGWMARVLDGDGRIIATAASMDYLKTAAAGNWDE